MGKLINVILVGFGDRGQAYTKFVLDHSDRIKVVGVVEPNPFRRNLARERFAIEEQHCFINVKDCIVLGKFADAVINTTMDTLHMVTAVPFLELGYHMLLEKPITNNRKQLLELKSCAEKYGAKLMICHVLRYTPFYLHIKEILASGEIGELIDMETAEMVGVAHSSCSYIRGKWNNSEKCGSSMLLAKCCHDMDLLCWFNNGTIPKKVSSFGGRHYFIAKNAPKGSGTRCLVDCEIETECPYSAKKIHLLNNAFPQYSWSSIEKCVDEITMEEKEYSLKTTNPHGVCIFKTEANIVDRQVLIMEFENGSTAIHSMISGVARPGRKIHLIGTKGEIEGFLESNKFVVRTFNPMNLLYSEREVVIENVKIGDGHSGGDSRIMEDFVRVLSGEPQSISCTSIEDSINGHLCIFAADASLLEGGAVKLVRG